MYIMSIMYGTDINNKGKKEKNKKIKEGLYFSIYV